MKRKPSRNRKLKGKAKESGLAEDGAAAQEGETTPTKSQEPQAVSVSTECGPPPPEMVFADAEQGPDRRVLKDYSDTIRLLREKGFSFREIAEWLHGYKIEADHNAVYRVYLSTVHPADVAQLEQELQEEEMDSQV